jgi:hypothetical protein
MKHINNVGVNLLSIWLTLTGLLPLFDLRFAYSGIILALLAVASGVLILLKR